MTENVRVVRVDTGQAQTSVKDLRNELKELRNTMLSCEKGTEEYNNALRQAAEIQHTLKEQMQEVNATAMDFGQIVGNCTQAVGGLVGGFQAATAVMNLFGAENEDVIKTLKTMQQLMAITQALPAIDKGVKAFKRLGIAIKASTTALKGFSAAAIATGLGAIVAALGLLIANWDKVSDAMKRWGIVHETTTEKIQKEKEKAEELKDKLDEARKAYDDWAKEQKVNNLSSDAKKEYDALSNSIDGYNLKLNKIVEEQKTASKDRWIELNNEGIQIHNLINLAKQRQQQILENAELTKDADDKRKEQEKERLKRLEDEKKALEEIKKKYGELAEDIKLYGASEYEKDLAKLAKAEQKSIETIDAALKKGVISFEQAEKDKLSIQKYYDKLRENAALEESKRQREISIELIDTSYQLEQAKLQKQYDEKLISEKEYTDRKKELLTNYVQDYVDNIQFILDTENTLTDKQILELTNKINTARGLLKADNADSDNSGTTLADGITNAINASALALTDFSDNPAWGNILRNLATITANWDNLHTQMKEGGTKAFSAYAQIAAAGLAAVANMMNGLAAEQDTSNKEGFESAKKFQIAGATMSMLAGVVSAWASSMQLGPIAGPILGAILTAMMVGTGIAQIVKIKNTQFDSKGGVNTSTTTPNTSAINSVIAPVQYTQDVQGASIEGAIKDSKVYVTETDITDTQNKVHVSESEARY